MIKKLCLVGAMSVLLAACSTQTFTVSPNAATLPKTNDMQSFFFYGVGQTKVVNAAQVCGGATRVASVQVKQTFVDALLSGITYGIYSPRHAAVYCTR